MANLPTRIRQSIRDQVTSPTSALSLKFATVSTTLGYPVVFDPEWPILWDMFQKHYPDPGTFIPSIARNVHTWCDAFLSWIERADNEESVDKLLDELKNVGRLEIVLNTSVKGVEARTRFDMRKHHFELMLPFSKPLSSSVVEASFASDLLQLFNGSTETTSSGAVAVDEPGWDDVPMHSPVIQQLQEIKIQDQEAPPSLPDIATIERPEDLIKKPPYWLIVRQERRNLVLIEGSHGPSLAVLEAYLKKWCRGEVGRADRPPVVEIRLRESSFGLGILYDTLVLETSRGREISATLVLVFIENVLGYALEPARGTAGGVWEFKRTRAFK